MSPTGNFKTERPLAESQLCKACQQPAITHGPQSGHLFAGQKSLHAGKPHVETASRKRASKKVLEDREQFEARLRAHLDAHFTKFATVIAVINAGFAADRSRKAKAPESGHA
jgi:hypothetical protein